MTHTLESFHFNTKKSGEIFKTLCKERGITRSVLAARSGLAYDTVDNCLKGRSEISFERVFKFCTILGMPIENYMLLLLKDEDYDFADDVLLYDLKADDTTPISDATVPEIPAPVPDAVADAAAAVATSAPVPPSATAPVVYTREEMDAVLELQERKHAAHVADLKEQLVRQDGLIRLLIAQFGD